MEVSHHPRNKNILETWRDGATGQQGSTPPAINKVAVDLQKSRGLSLVIQIWENFMRGISTTSPLPSGNHDRFITWLVLGATCLCPQTVKTHISGMISEMFSHNSLQMFPYRPSHNGVVQAAYLLTSVTVMVGNQILRTLTPHRKK